MSAITPFDFHGHQVRVLNGDDGEPRWVAADVAKILGYRSASDMTRNLRDRHTDTHNLRTRSETGVEQVRAVTVITEGGLYAAVLKSRRPDAEQFQDWVTDEVLPAIRRTGSYGAPSFDPATLTRSDILQIALNAETERLALEQKNAELSPKADAYDDFLDATGKYGVGAVAKMLGTSQNKLFRDLRNAGVLISKGTMRNTPYQRYMHHFEVKAHSYERSNGEQGTSYTTYVQPSGIDFIRRKLGFESIDPPARADAA